MNLYRALYQRADGSIRAMTYASGSAAEAHAYAARVNCGDKLLTVALDRPLQRPLLTLEA